MNKVFSYNVFDIGQCSLNEKDSSLLSLPKLQRGKVWKPQQIELLWDSLLRNFPIGTLIVLSESVQADCNTPPRGELLDGQQRVCSIISGFSEVTPQSDCVVWVDINAGPLNDREYTIRVTNRAHPWGYRLNGSVLEAPRRWAAIRAAGYQPGTSKLEWNILNFGPENDSADIPTLPIPLRFFLLADSEDKYQSVIEQCEKLACDAQKWGEKYLDKIKNTDSSVFYRYFEAIDRLRSDYSDPYLIPAIVIDTQTDLDLLFSRIGKQGTVITHKELTYALMKSYWNEEDFGPINELRAKGIIPVEDFAQIIFRLFYSKTSLHGEVAPDDVRSLRMNSTDPGQNAILNNILEAYHNRGERISILTSRVQEWILPCADGGQYHKLALTEIASKKPSLYILLLRLAIISDEKRLSLSQEYIQALAFYLYTCTWDDKAISRVYNRIVKETGQITGDLVSGVLRDCVSLAFTLPLVDSFTECPALQDGALNTSGSLERFQGWPGYHLFERLFTYGKQESSYVLKLAERHYFNKQYNDYDPSRKDLWEDLNRPWDHDHIVPQKWVGEYQEWSPFCLLWINSIGNIADIPFELNRKKLDTDDWSYYYEHAEDLLFFPPCGELMINEHLAEPGYEQQRKEFFIFTRDRFLRIANPFLRVLSTLRLNDGLSPAQELRKQLFLETKKKHPACKVFYLQNGIEYPFEDNDNFGWQQVWLTISLDYGHKERVAALTIAMYEDESYEVQCGLRKRPELYIEQLSNHDWWEYGKVIRRKTHIENKEGSIIAWSRDGWNPIHEFEVLLSDPKKWSV